MTKLYKSNNYRKEKVRTNTYTLAERNNFRLYQYVDYSGVPLKINKKNNEDL